MFNKVLAMLFLLATSMTLSAADNPLSVHVLNIQNGLPGAGIEVALAYYDNERWISLKESVTNQQGRISALYPSQGTIKKGVYKVTFKTGKWMSQNNTKTFFPEIPVIFEVDGTLSHYHIPLLLSPYGFSTYRGN
ncbi:MAG: hydroxyisourate hydrolase [Thiomicrospira sp.]